MPPMVGNRHLLEQIGPCRGQSNAPALLSPGPIPTGCCRKRKGVQNCDPCKQVQDILDHFTARVCTPKVASALSKLTWSSRPGMCPHGWSPGVQELLEGRPAGARSCTDAAEHCPAAACMLSALFLAVYRLRKCQTLLLALIPSAEHSQVYHHQAPQGPRWLITQGYIAHMHTQSSSLCSHAARDPQYMLTGAYRL